MSVSLLIRTKSTQVQAITSGGSDDKWRSRVEHSEIIKGTKFSVEGWSSIVPFVISTRLAAVRILGGFRKDLSIVDIIKTGILRFLTALLQQSAKKGNAVHLMPLFLRNSRRHTRTFASTHRRRQKFFQGEGQRQYFADGFQTADDAVQMDVH